MDIFLHLYGLITEGMLHAIDLLTPAPSEQALRACCVLRQTLLHAEEAYIHNPPPSDAPPILNRFSPQKSTPNGVLSFPILFFRIKLKPLRHPVLAARHMVDGGQIPLHKGLLTRVV